MLKKGISKTIALILMFLLVSLSILGCSGNAACAKEIELSIVYPSSTKTITVKENQFRNIHSEITPEFIADKLLIGYYAQDSKSGIEYIQSDGGMAGEWLSNYPTTLYAVYEDLDYDYEVKSKVQFDGKYKNVSGYPGSSFQKVITFYDYTDTKDEYLRRIFEQHTYLKVRLEMVFETKTETGDEIDCKLYAGSSEIVLKSYETSSSSWKTITVGEEISSRMVFGNDNVIQLNVRYRGKGANLDRPILNCSIRNLYLVCKLVKPQT